MKSGLVRFGSLVTLTVATLAVGSAGVASADPRPHVEKMGTVAPGIYKIEAVETALTMPSTCPAGAKCPPPPTMTTKAPSFVAQEDIYAAIAGATEIDTYAAASMTGTGGTSVYGCAIVGGGLKCWGSNSNGQLGTGDTTDAATPTDALDNGVPLSGVTDVSFSGSTTCVVDDGAVRCVGLGRFSSYKVVQRNVNETIQTVNGGTTSSSFSNRCENDVIDDSGTVVSTWVASGSMCSSSVSSTRWQTVIAGGAVKVQIGSGAMGSTTPALCVLMATGRVDCLLPSTTTGASNNTTYSTPYSTMYDCDGNTADFESNMPCMTTNYRSKSASAYSTEYPRVAITTQTISGVTDAVDISMPSDSWGSAQLCIATPASATCRSVSNGTLGKATTIKGSEGAEAVWITSGWGPTGLCVYASGTMKCGSGTYGAASQTGVTAVSPVAVMEKPLNVFYGNTTQMQKLYFLLPSGLLAADSWIFNCNNCYTTSTSKVTPVAAFTDAVAKKYYYLKGVTGSTDSPEFLPLTVETGVRNSRASVGITFTAGGQALTGSAITWVAPDYPGQYKSSATSSLKSDGAGKAKSALVSGPVTFSLSGGAIASGAVLQASSVTVLVPESGDVEVKVPIPGEVVQRKVSVTLPDGSPVPNATVQLKNNYFTYSYANSGGSTSSWASRAPDTNGWFASMVCAFCYVPPPVYVTGADGSVTFPSFDSGLRSTAYDADVTYDDGELSQNVQTTFTALSTAVELPFMARVALEIADANKATPEIEVNASANGASIPIEVQDENGQGISDEEVAAEEVCYDMQVGGLWSSSQTIDKLCSPSVGKAGVSTFASKSLVCKGSGQSTNAAGKMTVRLCPTSSMRIRLRSPGVLASKVICVRVKGVACSKLSSSSVPRTLGGGGRLATSVVLKAFGEIKGAGAVKMTFVGPCTRVGAEIITKPFPGVTCKITVSQASKGKIKGKSKVYLIKLT